MKLKKGDFVLVDKGKDRRKKGQILAIFSKENKALVEGINFVKKHMRPHPPEQTGGIQNKEAPISLANLSYFCLKCNQGTKVGHKFISDGKKVRFCKKCGEVIEK